LLNNPTVQLFNYDPRVVSSSPSRDQRHAEADRLFREAPTRGIPRVTTNLIIAETHRQPPCSPIRGFSEDQSR
jgi:hypothetical protein